jgi:hypothetical protein
MDTGHQVDTSSPSENGSSIVVPTAAESKNTTAGKGSSSKKERRFDPVNQMVPVVRSGVDTLSILDRIALRTNMVDWALLIPNFGAEFDIRNTNWNRWAVGFNVRYNWQTKHTYTNHFVYNLFEVRLEGRQYWRARQIGRRGLEKHKHFWDKAISIRRSKVKHPTTTWYRGVFASYGKYSFLFGGNGHQGTALMGGVCYGLVKPMFAFENGNSLDLEFGISGGVVYYKDKVYTHDARTDCYPVTETKPAAILPMINEVRVGLVYRLGHVPVLAKYRYRRDVDDNYDRRKDSIRTSHIHIRDSVAHYRATRESILRKFWQVYDEVAASSRRAIIQKNAANSKPADAITDDKKLKESTEPKDSNQDTQNSQETNSANTPMEGKEDERHE